ncbi:MAG: ECF transporter S component [Lachnospiraceae bacterium]|nr:ECF transporter S component [Lachnospiraceae bacterium]
MRDNVKKLTVTAFMLALGLVLPFLTGQIQSIGSMLLPMHLPVFLCALICGWEFGVPMAFILPLLRSFMFGMPPMYPTALAMAFELATYALVAGLLYKKSKQSILSLYVAMIAAMVAGRAVWGVCMMILLGVKGNTFTLSAFLSGALLNAIPGIILQLILIPVIMVALEKAKLIPIGGSKA